MVSAEMKFFKFLKSRVSGKFPPVGGRGGPGKLSEIPSLGNCTSDRETPLSEEPPKRPSDDKRA
jgi:hypothetical protein